MLVLFLIMILKNTNNLLIELGPGGVSYFLKDLLGILDKMIDVEIHNDLIQQIKIFSLSKEK